jgi:hypothetical protein
MEQRKARFVPLLNRCVIFYFYPAGITRPAASPKPIAA